MVVGDELDRIHRTVDQLRLLTTADRPGFLRPGPLEVTRFTAELLGKARALGERDWRLEAAGTGSIVADRQRLTQAVMQLVQNAVQHTGPGARIGLGSRVEAGEASFWVRDRSPGIAEADQRRTFARFARAAPAGWPDGTGLGLAIVQAIARAHHGRVELVSREGTGALLTLVVPVARPARRRRRPDGRQGGEPHPDRRGRARVAAFLEKGLRANGFTPTVAPPRRAALAAAVLRHGELELDLRTRRVPGRPAPGRPSAPASSSWPRRSCATPARSCRASSSSTTSGATATTPAPTWSTRTCAPCGASSARS